MKNPDPWDDTPSKPIKHPRLNWFGHNVLPFILVYGAMLFLVWVTACRGGSP